MGRSLIIFFLLLTGVIARPAEARTYAAIIVEESTGAVLHAVNPDVRAYPASLTKMMTLYLVFEALEAGKLTPDQELTISSRAARRPPSKLRLKAGSTISVRDAVAALVTKSANDVATAVAEALGGTEERFAQIMTARARQLGMLRTTFRNASGLPNRRQISTARDIARLVLALRRDFPQHFHVFSMESFRYRGREHRNHNKLLTRYEGTDGVKTGYVRASGYNIAASVEREGRRLIAVVFGGKSSTQRDRRAMALLNRAFQSIVAGNSPPVQAAAMAPWRKAKGVLARKVSLAPITAAAVADDADEDDWAIQVGAFERFAPAHLAASRATRLAPGLASARISVQQFISGKSLLYRAKLVGLSEGRAETACRTLMRKQMRCLVVQTDGGTAEGDR